MDNQLLITLKAKLDSLAEFGGVDIEVRRNVLKEELQFYVLNFIYHHPTYSTWTMYGGSALRICHGLNRMSVDLDFEIEHQTTPDFWETLKADVEKHFAETYNIGTELLRVAINGTRGLELRFLIGDHLKLDTHSKQVLLKIDLNHFVAPKTVTERISQNHDQLSFVIKTYNMSSLMASKLAAVFLRRERGVGNKLYKEKGRDIYDLLWYMERKVRPDLDYLEAKDLSFADLRQLFDKLTIRMNEVSDENLKQDLSPLFLDQSYIQNWIESWHDSYLQLEKAYSIRTVIKLQRVGVHEDFNTGNFDFFYFYETEDTDLVRFAFTVSDRWISSREGDLSIDINEEVVALVVDIKERLSDKLQQFVTLFYSKAEAYLDKTNHVVIGDDITTKIVRMTADKLNRKEEIVLNKSTLLSCGLEDLLK